MRPTTLPTVTLAYLLILAIALLHLVLGGGAHGEGTVGVDANLDLHLQRNGQSIHVKDSGTVNLQLIPYLSGGSVGLRLNVGHAPLA